MYAAQPGFEQSTLPFVSPSAPRYSSTCNARVPSGSFAEQPRKFNGAGSTPRLVRSVVDEAGLGRFVYLQGRSGRRYVFSSIRREQVSLYDHALLASSVPGSDEVQVSTSLTDLPADFSTLYVHLLDSEVCDAEGALDDLGARNLQDA